MYLTMSQRPLEHILKLFLFLLLVFLILRQVPTEGLWSQLKEMTPTVAFTAILLMITRFLLMGMRWRVASDTRLMDVRWFLRNEWHILFLEMAVPIPDAEDALRMALLRSKGLTWAQGIRSVFYLRLTGLAMMCVILIAFVVIHGARFFEIAGQWNYGLLAMLILLMTFFARPTMKFSIPLLEKIPKVGGRLAAVVSSAIEKPFQPKRIALLIMLSGLHLLVQACLIQLLLVWVANDVPFLDVFLITPILALSFLLPLSIQGLGLPEAALLLILPRFGVSLEDAGAIAAVHLMAYIAIILMGGLLFTFDKNLTVSRVLKIWKDGRK